MILVCIAPVCELSSCSFVVCARVSLKEGVEGVEVFIPIGAVPDMVVDILDSTG